MAVNIGSREIARRLADVWAGLIERNSAAGGAAPAGTAIASAPVVWLLGKVQSGKTSIIQAVTGASDADIGSGFRACTTSSRIFDFPAEAPVLRFLDTRGIGEAGYDPAEDLGLAERRSHVLIVVMRALDPQQEVIVDVVRRVRARHPGWPVIVAQTCLHDAYKPGENHPPVYPYKTEGLSGAVRVPEDLARALAHQRRLFDRLEGTGPLAFVPLDFTQPGDGYTPRHFGLEALHSAFTHAAPAGIAAILRQIRSAGADALTRRINGISLGYATAAAALDVVPVAGAVAVPATQAKLLHALGDIHGVAWNRRTLAEFAGCLGAGILTKLLASFGIRELAKLVPVYGQTAGAAAAAAASFVTTYAIGRAAHVYLASRNSDNHDPAQVAAAYREALESALGLARARGLDVTEEHAQR